MTSPPTTATPRTLYAELIRDLMREAVVSSPPRCQSYMDASDFEAMGEHVRDFTARVQQYLTAIGSLCAENGGSLDTTAFEHTFDDALSDVSHYLTTAAERYRGEHAEAAE